MDNPYMNFQDPSILAFSLWTLLKSVTNGLTWSKHFPPQLRSITNSRQQPARRIWHNFTKLVCVVFPEILKISLRHNQWPKIHVSAEEHKTSLRKYFDGKSASFSETRGPWWPYIAHLNHVIQNIANKDAVLKVMVTLIMTFALTQGHLLVRRNIPTTFEGPSSKHCRVIICFVLEITVTLTFVIRVIH